MAEFMEEKFQIKDRNVNIMDILNTMISPKDVESTVAANGVRENVQACTAKKNRKKRSAGNKITNLPEAFILHKYLIYATLGNHEIYLFVLFQEIYVWTLQDLL